MTAALSLGPRHYTPHMYECGTCGGEGFVPNDEIQSWVSDQQGVPRGFERCPCCHGEGAVPLDTCSGCGQLVETGLDNLCQQCWLHQRSAGSDP